MILLAVLSNSGFRLLPCCGWSVAGAWCLRIRSSVGLLWGNGGGGPPRRGRNHQVCLRWWDGRQGAVSAPPNSCLGGNSGLPPGDINHTTQGPWSLEPVPTVGMAAHPQG